MGCRNLSQQGIGRPIEKELDSDRTTREFVTVRFGFRGGRNKAGSPDKNLKKLNK